VCPPLGVPCFTLRDVTTRGSRTQVLGGEEDGKYLSPRRQGESEQQHPSRAGARGRTDAEPTPLLLPFALSLGVFAAWRES
jgi:hypothetical protein